jgi:pimeloyl-ACP methyl ester carboxylesterase
MTITISFTILLSNNIYFLSYGENITTAKTTTTNNLNLFSISANKVKVGYIDIGYKKIGTGPPIFLITGYSVSMNNCPPTLTSNLSKDHTVFIFDNRGIGNTTLGYKNFTINQFTQDTIGLMDALHINKTDVMGFSMGGFIAQEISVTNPQKINKLVIYASVCGGPESTPLEEN